jgi:hypothetical protein
LESKLEGIYYPLGKTEIEKAARYEKDLWETKVKRW